MGNTYFTVTGHILTPTYFDVDHSEIPDQHKCAHILALDNGNYAAQPNNRILWSIPSFTTSTIGRTIKYKLQNGMSKKRWQLDDTDNMFYGIDKKE
jgi:hypothetical protein